MGVGVSIYFKSLKNMVVILLICTLLSLPAYLLFWSGRTLNNPDKSADESLSFTTMIASLSLANIGEISVNLNQLNLYKTNLNKTDTLELAQVKKFSMFCETGLIGEIEDHGIALPQDIDNEIDFFVDTYCDIERT